jgi:outer membrane immunogenic protein
MKRIIPSIFFAAVLSAPALGADMAPAYKAPPFVGYNWTGFYVGGDIGVAWQHASGTSNFFQDITDPAFANNFQHQSLSKTSLIGGIHAGYNWQFAPQWVAGIEGDWQWAGSKHSFCRQTDIDSVACTETNNKRGFASIDEKTQWISTLRGRLGWVFGQTMLYGTGGVAFRGSQTSLAVQCLVGGCGDADTNNATAAKFSTHKTGWVAGLGLEHLFTQNWSIRAEYLHADFRNQSNTLFLDPINCTGNGICGVSWSRNNNYDILRTGISYKFGAL